MDDALRLSAIVWEKVMFWDRVAGVYDIFANVINAKTHRELCARVGELIESTDDVLECACGTGLLTSVVAPRCRSIVATDFSENMLKQTKRKCAKYRNVTVENADILKLSYKDWRFDKVIAGNVIHLLDEPRKALSELDRVCKIGGQIIIPTYMNKNNTGKESGFAGAVGKAGADFKRQFNYESYQDFFAEAGYTEVEFMMIEGRVPCALAIIKK